MKTKSKKKLDEKPFFVNDEVDELKAEIAPLRGALRAVKNAAKMNLNTIPRYMLK